MAPSRNDPRLGKDFSSIYEKTYESEVLSETLFKSTEDTGVDESPPKEPPSSTETPGLPSPEYIKIIRQAERPPDMSEYEAKFRVNRPDKDPRFYGQGNTKSTRVRAMQWIPTSMDEVGTVAGDIFVAFARPSKGKSSLFVYRDKNRSNWDYLSSNKSIGHAIIELGTPLDQRNMTEGLYSIYRELHPLVTDWIFESSDWMSIRPGNSLPGDPRERAPRSIAGKARKVGEAIVRETGKGPRDFMSTYSDDDDY